MKLLKNARIVTDGKVLEGRDVAVENGIITGLFPHDPLAAGVDLGGAYLAPGFIDLHCHGGGGYEFCDGTEEAIHGAAKLHAEHGTRVLFPTLSALDPDVLWRALEAAEKYKDKAALEMPGVHIEGPYFSQEMVGGQDASAIREPDEKEYLPILERFAPIIARWDYAPEHDRDGKFLAALNRYGVKPAVAHSAAEYDDLMPAYENGCRLVTHLYSCTSTITRHGGFRHLGIIETAYLTDGMDVEAIGDGCHLPAELMRLIVKCKTPEHVCLITDAIRYGGMDSGDEKRMRASRVPYVIEDGVAKLMDRSAFAGSIATTERILKATVKAGIPLGDVVKMLTETPARVMGLTKKGRIAPGYEAQFTVFDGEMNVLQTQA